MHGLSLFVYGGVLKLGVLFRDPHSKECSISGSILGPPICVNDHL